MNPDRITTIRAEIIKAQADLKNAKDNFDTRGESEAYETIKRLESELEAEFKKRAKLEHEKRMKRLGLL